MLSFLIKLCNKSSCLSKSEKVSRFSCYSNISFAIVTKILSIEYLNCIFSLLADLELSKTRLVLSFTAIKDVFGLINHKRHLPDGYYCDGHFPEDVSPTDSSPMDSSPKGSSAMDSSLNDICPNEHFPNGNFPELHISFQP